MEVKKRRNGIQFIRFAMVGLSNTFVGYMIYVVALKMIRSMHVFEAMDIYVAQAIMFLLSVLWSFFWNKKLVFDDGSMIDNTLVQLVKTYTSYAFTNLFLSEVLLHLWVNKYNISEYYAPLINLLITVPINFELQKYWVYGKVKNEN